MQLLRATLDETYSCGDSFRFARNSLLSRQSPLRSRHEAPKTNTKVGRSREGGVRKKDLFFWGGGVDF
jgi:hypothetical protein